MDDGWLVTLGEADPPNLSQGNAVQLLPDGELACNAMIESIDEAENTIHLVQLEFDPDFFATFVDFTDACPPQPVGDVESSPKKPIGGQRKLVDALIAAARREGVRVRILLNYDPQSILPSSSYRKLEKICRETNIELADLGIMPRSFGLLHAKAVVVDGSTAFLSGLPFAQGYLDTQLHCVTDPRRGDGAGGDFPPLGGVGNGVGNKPAHTVSLKMDGPSASDMNKTFIDLWNSVSTSTIDPPRMVPDRPGRQSIQIVRSSPPLQANGLSNGEKGVLESYLRAIHNAQNLIYIEAQYYTSPIINNSLRDALRAKQELQLILLVNENPDIPTYKFWQNDLLSPLMRDFPDQVGVFSLWRTQRPHEGQEKVRIMQCYMEAKVAIVDDRWGSIGSANLDGVSLDHAFEFIPTPCLSASDGWRNVEINAILYDGIAGQPGDTGEVFRIRNLLWNEHLESVGGGEPLADAGLSRLSIWTNIANDNIRSLNLDQSMSGRILPYSPALSSKDQLIQLGIDVNRLDVAPVVPH
ncbi:phospholipase D-like domain-containing protein [Ktedonobacter robiniae]|uniref:PLD phosphodiesterase domain-containing protein n=1 Tax=Ktedonobacter robiniae TaxID=2778365 RepID=A0ABQ3UN87_9CHLR|nr:phosphatidylserine/phosphatidylglycerophosphate/cardiolipin synthase family protein [Ktedonobacter robiniae]GHO54178.1 hypothetical protein KSB_26530 [Ktedonobacter robiniae]